MFALSSRSKQRMEGVDSRLIDVAELAIKLTVVDFGIPADGGLRTAKRQYELFLSGKSKADGVKHKSYHQSGLALDFYAYIDGRASWDHEHLAVVAAAFLQAASILKVSLNWGGLWTSTKKINGIPYGWDMAHLELG